MIHKLLSYKADAALLPDDIAIDLEEYIDRPVPEDDEELNDMGFETESEYRESIANVRACLAAIRANGYRY